MTAQSVGAIEFADCISAEGIRPPKDCPVDDIKPFDGEAPT